MLSDWTTGIIRSFSTLPSFQLINFDSPFHSFISLFPIQRLTIMPSILIAYLPLHPSFPSPPSRDIWHLSLFFGQNAHLAISPNCNIFIEPGHSYIVYLSQPKLSPWASPWRQPLRGAPGPLHPPGRPHPGPCGGGGFGVTSKMLGHNWLDQIRRFLTIFWMMAKVCPDFPTQSLVLMLRVLSSLRRGMDPVPWESGGQTKFAVKKCQAQIRHFFTHILNAFDRIFPLFRQCFPRAFFLDIVWSTFFLDILSQKRPIFPHGFDGGGRIFTPPIHGT